VAYSTTNTTPDVNGSYDEVTSTSFNITGLTANTTYYAWVRAKGNDGHSAWSSAYSFKTAYSTPFAEEFGSSSTPTGWMKYSGLMDNVIAGTASLTANSGKWDMKQTGTISGYHPVLNLYGTTYNGWFVTPNIELASNQQIAFKLALTAYGNSNAAATTGTDDRFAVLVSTDNGESWTKLREWNNSGSDDVLNNIATAGEDIAISLAAYNNQIVKIAFYAESTVSNADNDIHIGNVEVSEIPACPKPTGLTASNETYNSVVLSWTAGSDETEWKVVYGAAGFNPASEGTTVDNVTENPYTLTGLSPETAYDVYVKAVKGSDVSPVSNKANFTTTERYPAPTGLVISNLTKNSATLTWVAGSASSWEVAINTTGTTPTEAGTVVNAATYDFSELTAETTYYAFVREKDGDNYSNWSAACEFTPSAYTYLTVNDGTATNNYIPIYANGIWSSTKVASQFLILSTALTDMVNCELKKMTFYSSSDANDFGGGKFEVYLAEVNNTTISSTKDWTEMTKVFNEGTLSVSGGKMTIVFDNAFEYKGGNLLVGIKQTVKDQNGTNIAWYGVNTSVNMSRYVTGTENKKFSPKTTIGYQAKTGSELKVFDGETELAESPASFDFGLATASTTHTFTLKNTAATPYVATISSENLTVDPTEVTPTAEGVTFTVAMPAQDITNEAVVITPANESGLEPFTINVSGTLRNNDKFYQEFNTTSKPTGWTTDGTWSYSAANGASTSAWYIDQQTLARLKTPMLTVAAGEKFIVEAKGYSTTNTDYQHMVLQYSADGTNWTTFSDDFGTTISADPTKWNTYTVTWPNNVEAGNYYIAILASQADIRMFYGGEEAKGANFAINTDGSTQDFGSVKFGATAQKTFTITNNGNKSLFINIDSPADFTATMTANAEDKNVFFTDALNWGSPNVYYWPNGGEWPGMAMTELYTNDQGQKVYYYELPENVTGIIFNGNGNQTVDITEFNSNAYYTTNSTDGQGHYYVGNWTYNNCVPAGKSSVLTINMNTATAGDKSGNVVLSFDALNATEFTIPCTGNVKDENYLAVDFQDGQFPTGWQVGADWSAATGTAIQSNTQTASALVTTPLTVAENETLTFKACRNASGYGNVTSLKTRYSVDGGANWSNYVSYNVETSALTSQTISGIPAGKVIIEFLGSNIKLDDIEGFTKTTAPAIALSESTDAVANDDTKDFGFLNANGTATYTLKNIGNDNFVATLSGENVTVSPANVNLAAGATADITVTMAYAEPYGEKTGSMTISSESWVGDFTVNFTANLVDPTAFVVDFESGQPAGWYLDTWTVSDGTAHINVGGAKPMITELVGAEEGKNTLTFDAKLQYDYGYGTYTLDVYTSTDRKTWNEAQTFTLTGTSQTFSLDPLSDGNYYVKFEAANASIDNIKGVKKLAASEHDLYLVSATLPTDEIMPIDTYTATVKVASLRANEEVTAELYFGETKVADKVLTINNGATETIEISGTAPAAGTFEVYAKVYNSEVTVETEKVSVTVEDKTELSLTGFTRVAAAVTADNNNMFTAEFNVTVKNTGSTAFTADEVSVTVTDGDNNEYETATWTSGETIYLKAGNYTADNANFAIYRWSTDNDSEWALFTGGTNGIYTASLNGKENFIICRVNPATAESDLDWNDNIWTQSNNLTTATGVVFENNGYYDGKLQLTQSNNFIAGMSATITVTVTADAGNGGEFAFNAKENVSDAYWYSTLGSLQYVNVTAAPVIVLNETVGTVDSEGNNRKVRLTHSFVEGWNTICLPFAITASEIATGAKAMAFKAYDATEQLLTFSPVTELEANKPYVIYVPEAITEPLEFTGKTVATSEELGIFSNGITFQGTYTPMTSDLLTGTYGMTAAGKLAKAKETTTMKGFRAYMTGDVPAEARVMFVDEEGVVTSIATIENGALKTVNAIYNMKGQKVEKMQKGGLYIIDGKKTVVK